ncbi:MAG: hypothetical protein IJ211_04435 [Campylobacter sp.]|nr:hypothetical protein [Campylobacter sp.]
MSDKLIGKIKDLISKYHKFGFLPYAFIITILLKVILNLLYFNKFNSSANFDLTDLNILLMLFTIIFLVLSIYIGNLSQMFFIADWKIKKLKHLIVTVILIANKLVLIITMLFVIFLDFAGLYSDTAFKIFQVLIYVYLILCFLFIILSFPICSNKNIFLIGLLIVIIQDILLIGMPTLIYKQNISNTNAIKILLLMIFFYVMPILFGLLIRKEFFKKELYIKILVFISIVPLFIILYFSAPNLLRNSSFANKDVIREIEIKNLPDELIQNLDKNFTKFSCKNLKGYSCFEKKGDNSYEIKNLRFLATNIQEIDLYCIILPKDENSTLNNLPKDENIYIDLNGLKDI